MTRVQPAAAALNEELASLRAPWLEAENLPPICYHHPGIFDREVEAIFRREWINVGRIEDIPGPGDFITAEIVDQPVIVLRDNDGHVRAHMNICRHRGSPLLTADRGCVKSLRCPYHGWMYGLDGSLRATPEFNGVKNFDKGKYPLRSVRLEVWQGFLMVNLDPEATPFGDRLRGTEVWGLDKYELGSRVTTHKWTYAVSANWKLLCENYFDEYHLPWVHAETFQAWTPLKGYKEIHPGDLPGYAGQDDLPWNLVLARYPGYTYSDSGEPLFECSPELDDLAPEYQGLPISMIFPTFGLNPTVDVTATYVFRPLSPTESTVEMRLMLPREAAERFHAGNRQVANAAEQYVRNMSAAAVEDNEICEAVQRSLASPGATRGRYGPREGLIWRFVNWVATAAYADWDPKSNSGRG